MRPIPHRFANQKNLCVCSSRLRSSHGRRSNSY